MKKIYNILYGIMLGALLVIPMSSCEDYLDKAPSSDITETDVYGTFQSFQGFVEQMYQCVIDPDKCGAWNKYLFADETLGPSIYQFDVGNWWGNETYFFGTSPNVTSNEGRDRRIWEWSWYGIRVANLAIEHLNGTEDRPSEFTGSAEEKNLLMGQALYFRAWFYFEICRFWGGMPYITHPIAASEDMTTEEYNRLSFQATCLKMAEDFRAAADLLPDHWDNTTTGQATLGHNNQRINKFYALGYLGKCLLFAASPMPNQEATGSNSYNAELCSRAAKAFGELLTLADQTGIYKLTPWSRYENIFYKENYQFPGEEEVIMNPTIGNRTRVRWSALGATVPSSFGQNSGSSADVPTWNIIQNYGMANGLPIDDPDSGYNPADPWTNRDPRFYVTICKDGDRISNLTPADYYLQSYVGGYHRTINPGTVTGFYARKFNGMGAQLTANFTNQLQAYQPYLRMADVYLMYAEAVNFMSGGGPTATSGNYSMTAVDAVNAVRNRAGVPNMTEKYYASKDAFFENLVRERAVELILEGQRFDDLRRWNRIADPRYLDKTALDFDRGADGKPINIRERVVRTRVAEQPKHNWLPIQVSYTKSYAGFGQNPGW